MSAAVNVLVSLACASWSALIAAIFLAVSSFVPNIDVPAKPKPDATSPRPSKPFLVAAPSPSKNPTSSGLRVSAGGPLRPPSKAATGFLNSSEALACTCSGVTSSGAFWYTCCEPSANVTVISRGMYYSYQLVTEGFPPPVFPPAIEVSALCIP